MAWIAGFLGVVLLFVFITAIMARGHAAHSVPNVETLSFEAVKIEGLCASLHKRGLAAGRYDEADLKSAQRGPRCMVAAWELMEWAVPGSLERGRSGDLVDALGLMNCATVICGSFLRNGIGKEPVLEQVDLASDVCFAMFLGAREDVQAPWIMKFAELLATDRNEFAAIVDRAVLAMSLPPTEDQVVVIGRLIHERVAAVQIRFSTFRANNVK